MSGMKDRARPAPPDPKVVICGQSPVSSLIFGPQETYKERPVIISGHENGRIIEWSVTTQRAAVSWQGHRQSVIWLAWVPPEKLLSQGRDGVVRVWAHDRAVWTCIGEIPCAQFVFCDSALTLCDNQVKLAVPSEVTSQVDVHTLDQCRLLSQTSVMTPADSQPVSALSQTSVMTPADSQPVSALSQTSVMTPTDSQPVSALSQTSVMTPADSQPVSALSQTSVMTPADSQPVSALSQTSVMTPADSQPVSALSQTSVMTPADSQPVSALSHSLKPLPVESYGMCMRLRMFTHSSRGPRLLVAYESGTLTLWDLLGGVPLTEVKAHEDSIMAVGYWVSPESDMITCVTGSANEVIKSWQIDKDVFVEGANVSVTNPGMSDIAVRGDGRIFASAGWDHRVRVFSLRKLRPLAVLTYHTSTVHCVSFAPDNTLATGSKDGYIALWDVYKDK